MAKVLYENEIQGKAREENTQTIVGEEEISKPSPHLEKPYLKIGHLEKGNPKNELVLLEWLDFLFKNNDMQDFIEVLSYYVDLGWISSNVRNYLISYARGIIKNEKGDKTFSEVQMGTKKYKLNKNKSQKNSEKNRKNSQIGKTKPQHHIQSLIYILEILKEKIPEEEYEKILDRAETTREINV